MENPINMDDLGVPLFLETSMLSCTQKNRMSQFGAFQKGKPEPVPELEELSWTWQIPQIEYNNNNNNNNNNNQQ